MGKITSYPAATTFDSDSDVILKDGTNGTKKMTVGNLAAEMNEFWDRRIAWNRRNAFRAWNLGTSFTSEHNAALSGENPKFDRMYIGSYWTINDHRYDIVDFDYWYDKYDTLDGNNSENVHHVVLIPRFNSTEGLGGMNETNMTEGGYLGSRAYTSGMDALRQIIEQDWGSHIMTHRANFTNSVDSNGVANGHVWVDSKIDLMNSFMVYGHNGVSNDGGTISADRRTSDRDQLAVFKLYPGASKYYYGWLRDVSSSTTFSCLSSDGMIDAHSASNSDRYRPVFAIKAT